MSQYLKRRRKIGVCMLIVACLRLAGWVRSLSMFEVIAAGYLRAYSHNGVVNIQKPKESLKGKTWYFGYNSGTDPSGVDGVFWSFRHTRWWINGFGFAVGQGKQANRTDWTHTIILIPYWSLVIPLTTLSAWLLLRKPRLAKSKSPIDPIPETVA